MPEDIKDADQFDARLDEADEEALKSFAAFGCADGSPSMFHNVFFNAFVNSPNFTKRLRHPDRPR